MWYVGCGQAAPHPTPHTPRSLRVSLTPLDPALGPRCAGVAREVRAAAEFKTRKGRNGTTPVAGPARGGGPLRAPNPAVEPEDSAIHFRRAFGHLHHRSPEDAASAPAGTGAVAVRRAAQRRRDVRVHEEAAERHHPGRSAALRRLLRDGAVAGRDAHEFPDDQAADQAAARPGAGAFGRRVPAPHEEGTAAVRPRAAEAREVPLGHQEYEPPAGDAVRGGREEG